MLLKVFPLIVLATLTVLNPARADDTNTTAFPKIGATNTTVIVRIVATNASQHYGETAIVTGKIVEVAIRPRVVILHFEKPYPKSPFTGVIFSEATNLFGDLSALKGKSVEVKGTIKNYRDKPEIILTATNQLTIIPPPPGTEDEAPAPVPK